MKKFLENYKQSVILLGAVIIGVIVGCIWGEGAKVLTPLGDVFINMMFVIIVPLIFLTLSTSISRMGQPKRIGKIMRNIAIVIVITSLVAVIAGILGTYFVDLVNPADGEAIRASLDVDAVAETEELSILSRTVQVLFVEDFNGLLTRQNIIGISVFSILFGLAMNMAGEKAKALENVLVSASEVIMKLLQIVMYYAPIGLGCYSAALVGTFGAEIAIGYGKTFVVYTIVTTIFFFAIYSLYALIAGGKKGFKTFWVNILPPSVTALATCSSAAAIPTSITAVKKMGVSDDIAESMIPIGTNFHKDGSIIGSVFKIMFLVGLFGTSITGIAGIGKILGVALIATLLVTAVPIGGGTISEMMIITMMGYPVAALPILTIIATIIDPEATLLNVVGDSSCALLAARLTDGKDWMKEKITDGN